CEPAACHIPRLRSLAEAVAAGRCASRAGGVLAAAARALPEAGAADRLPATCVLLVRGLGHRRPPVAGAPCGNPASCGAEPGDAVHGPAGRVQRPAFYLLRT